jgi:hypothetical protein
MKGNLVKYVEEYNNTENIAIVIDYKPGYNLRKSWSEECSLIEEPLIKVYWLNAPTLSPETAKFSIMGDWNLNEEQDLFEPNVIIDEWDELDDRWYLASLFQLVEESWKQGPSKI